MPDRIPELVFISYSRQDQKWLQQVENHLGALVRAGIVKPWIDRGEIEYGDKFREEIGEAIDTCSAAIILVSPHFQNSKFITENELPRLLRHANARELKLYWINVADCVLADELHEYHAVNDSKKDLISMTEAEVNAVLARMARHLRQHVMEARDVIRSKEHGAKRSPPPPGSPVKKSFTNSLGMPFLPVPGLDGVLFCQWQTRVQDYAAFAAENPRIDMSWKNYEYQGHKQGPDHPVINVSWEDAVAFCQWLSKKEGRAYRLPTDHEWSVAVGIGDQEDPKATPQAKDEKIKIYPWGPEWPPPEGSGNFAGEECKIFSGWTVIEGYRDQFPFTAPVGSFKLEHHGIKDLSGNVWEWCQDWYDKDHKYRVLRGGSWPDLVARYLASSFRRIYAPSLRSDDCGFRCVCGVG